MAEVRIEDFIPVYPKLEEENFFLDLAKKKELQELTLSPTPEDKGDEVLFASQKYMQRMFSPYTPYTRAAFFHDPGTG